MTVRPATGDGTASWSAPCASGPSFVSASGSTTGGRSKRPSRRSTIRAPATGSTSRSTRKASSGSDDSPPRRRPRARPGRVLPRLGASSRRAAQASTRLGAKQRGRHGRGRLRGRFGSGRRAHRVLPRGPARRRVERVDVFKEAAEGISGFRSASRSPSLQLGCADQRSALHTLSLARIESKSELNVRRPRESYGPSAGSLPLDDRASHRGPSR